MFWASSSAASPRWSFLRWKPRRPLRELYQPELFLGFFTTRGWVLQTAHLPPTFCWQTFENSSQILDWFCKIPAKYIEIREGKILPPSNRSPTATHSPKYFDSIWFPKILWDLTRISDNSCKYPWSFHWKMMISNFTFFHWEYPDPLIGYMNVYVVSAHHRSTYSFFARAWHINPFDQSSCWRA